MPAKPPFPIGCLVLTPLYRLAHVVSYDKSGYVDLRYVGLDDGDTVRLKPELLSLPQ